jgi:hypothetical protein
MRAGDILTLILHDQDAPPGHFAMVLAARMEEPDRGLVYVAAGSTGPLRTVAVDLLRIVPRDPALRWPSPGKSPPRPPEGCAFLVELNRTSLLLPTRRISLFSPAGRAQLKVRRLG